MCWLPIGHLDVASRADYVVQSIVCVTILALHAVDCAFISCVEQCADMSSFQNKCLPLRIPDFQSLYLSSTAPIILIGLPRCPHTFVLKDSGALLKGTSLDPKM